MKLIDVFKREKDSTTDSQTCHCVLSPLYIPNDKPYSLSLVSSYQYDLFSDGWFEFWCPKPESSLGKYGALGFQSNHLEKTFLLLILQVSRCLLTSVRPLG